MIYCSTSTSTWTRLLYIRGTEQYLATKRIDMPAHNHVDGRLVRDGALVGNALASDGFGERLETGCLVGMEKGSVQWPAAVQAQVHRRGFCTYDGLSSV